jgi:hypothetical protein
LGVWGAGLYSGDFAQDLRPTIAAVARLPFEPAELLVILRKTESAADDPQDSDHTVFWLVVADQFRKRGIDCPEARDAALAILAGGEDLALMARLGMDAKTLAKRRVALDDVEARLKAPLAVKPRKVLKSPQQHVAEAGEVLIYPVNEKGDPINPYIVGKPWPVATSWKQAAWGACVIVDIGRAFDFLAWCRPLVVVGSLDLKPDLAALSAPRRWLMRSGGTLSQRHFQLMEMERLGPVALDAAKLDAIFGRRPPDAWAAVNDVSIANRLNVRDLDVHEAHRIKHGYPPTPRIEALGEVVTPA